ncbi:TolC family protein [Nitratifractor sp.]
MRRTVTVLMVAAATLLPARTLTVDDLIGIALRHSPDVDLGRYGVEGARALHRSVRSVRLPHVDLSVRLERERDQYRHAPDTTTDTLEGTLSATQLLYDFGKSAGTIESAAEGVAASREEMRQIVSDKILEVKERYYDALKALTMIWVYTKNLHLQEQHLHRAEKYLKAGVKTAVDVSDARLQLKTARKDLSDAHYLYRTKRTLLEESLGTIPYGGDYRLYRGPVEPSKWHLPAREPSLPSLLAYAMKHRPVLKSMTHLVRSAAATAHSKGLYMTPTVELYGEVGAKGLDVGSGARSHEKVGVRMNWNLFSGYADSADAQIARIETLKAQANRRKAKLAIRREVTQAYYNLRHVRKMFALNWTIVEQAKKKYLQAKKRYMNDLGDYIELQDAQQDYIKSLADLVNSYYDYFIARAQLDHAIGK